MILSKMAPGWRWGDNKLNKVFIFRIRILAVYGGSESSRNSSKISEFLFRRWKKVLQVWNDMRVSNYDRILIFGWTYPFKYLNRLIKTRNVCSIKHFGALWQKHVNTRYLIEPMNFYSQNELNYDHLFFSVTYIEVKQLLETEKQCRKGL